MATSVVATHVPASSRLYFGSTSAARLPTIQTAKSPGQMAVSGPQSTVEWRIPGSISATNGRTRAAARAIITPGSAAAARNPAGRLVRRDPQPQSETVRHQIDAHAQGLLAVAVRRPLLQCGGSPRRDGRVIRPRVGPKHHGEAFGAVPHAKPFRGAAPPPSWRSRRMASFATLSRCCDSASSTAFHALREAVVVPEAPVDDLFTGVLDEALGDEAVERGVEGARPQDGPAVGEPLDVLHHAVAMTTALGECDQDQEGGFAGLRPRRRHIPMSGIWQPGPGNRGPRRTPVDGVETFGPYCPEPVDELRVAPGPQMAGSSSTLATVGVFRFQQIARAQEAPLGIDQHAAGQQHDRIP